LIDKKRKDTEKINTDNCPKIVVNPIKVLDEKINIKQVKVNKPNIFSTENILKVNNVTDNIKI
jgi:hypothetical protein